VKEIFAERGEEGFRHIEQNVLHEVGEFESVIVACGGGTPCYFDNMEYMNEKGITVFLNASHEALMRRLSIPKAKAKRPIIANKTDEELSLFITEAMQQRAPHYNKAMLTFDSSYLEDSPQVAESTETLAKILMDIK
jgi:shikimate kinase